MSVHHKIHDYFHNTPVSKTVNKKHYHPREGKYPRYYAYPLEDWQVVYQKITGLIRKFEGKTPEELYSYITNCYDYKNTPAFRQVWNSHNKEIFKDLCLSTKEEPYGLHSRINSAFYVDHSNKICVINNLKSEHTNPKNDPVYIAGQDDVVYVKINIKHHQATNKEKTPYTTFTQKVDSACKRAIYRKAKKA